MKKGSILQFKKNLTIIHQSSAWMNVFIFELDNINVNSMDKIFSELISSKYFQWNYDKYPDGFQNKGNKIHGPFLINKISATDFKEIAFGEMIKKISNTINNQILYNDIKKKILDEEFIKETNVFLNSIIGDNFKYYTLDMEFPPDNYTQLVNNKISELHPFNFFSSYVVVSENNLYMIQIGED